MKKLPNSRKQGRKRGILRQLCTSFISFTFFLIIGGYFLTHDPLLPFPYPLVSTLIKGLFYICMTPTYGFPDGILPHCRSALALPELELHFKKSEMVIETFTFPSLPHPEVSPGDLSISLFYKASWKKNGGAEQGSKQKKKKKLIYYVHGGGWSIGSPLMYHEMLEKFVMEDDYIAAGIKYRLAPEHKFPTAAYDVLDGYDWLHSNLRRVMEERLEIEAETERVVLMGDSAGGNLLATLTHLLKSQTRLPKPALQVLIYPATTTHSHRLELDSCKRYGKKGYLLDEYVMKRFSDFYRPLTHKPDEQREETEPRESLLTYNDHHNIPPAFVFLAGLDPLKSEGLLYAEKMRERGVEVEVFEANDTFHGSVTLSHEKATFWNIFARFMQKHLG